MTRMTIVFGASLVGLATIAPASFADKKSSASVFKTPANFNAFKKQTTPLVLPRGTTNFATRGTIPPGRNLNVNPNLLANGTKTLSLPKNPVVVPGFQMLPPRQRRTIEAIYNKYQGTMSAKEKDAFNKVLSGDKLSALDRESLSGMLVGDRGLTMEDREAINQALEIDYANQQAVRRTRFLYLFNDTSEPVRVWVQYLTLTDKKEWVWFPARPDESAKAVVVDVKAGEARWVVHDDWHVKASQARLWAKSASGKEYKALDLVLVKEVDDAGQPAYYAAETGTYTHMFRTPTTAVSGLKR